jgi:hypothetical protein
MGNRGANGVRRGASVTVALTSLLFLIGCTPVQSETESVLRIGIPDGVGGILASYTMEKMGDGAMAITPLRDCCSSTAEWALSGDDVDAAILCPDAALSLIEKDNRYVIIGPFVANSDVVVIRGEVKTGKIGIAQNHFYQAQIVKSLFGSQYEVTFLMPSALPYAYERGLIDGVVIDISPAGQLNGQRFSSRNESGDFVTYVLATRKDLQDKPEFKRLIRGPRGPSVGHQEIRKFSHQRPGGGAMAKAGRASYCAGAMMIRIKA